MNIIIKEIKNNYSISQKINLFIRLIITKLFYPGQRLIRNNFEIRGKDMVHFGKGLTTGVGCRIEAFIADGNNDKKIFFGDYIQMNDYVHISALQSVTIGSNTLIASNVYISDNSHGFYKGSQKDTSPYVIPTKRPYYVAAVTIEERVWLGEGVIVMPGVKIGEGAIVGAHSIVNRDIPSNSIAVGSPARVIKQYNKQNKCWEKII